MGHLSLLQGGAAIQGLGEAGQISTGALVVVAPMDSLSVVLCVNCPQEVVTDSFPDTTMAVTRALIGGLVLLATSFLIILSKSLYRALNPLQKLACTNCCAPAGQQGLMEKAYSAFSPP